MSDLYDSDTDTDNDTQVQVRPTDNDDDVTVVEDIRSVEDLPLGPPPELMYHANIEDIIITNDDNDDDNEKMKMIKANIPKLLELLGKNDDLQTTLFDMLNKPEEDETASEVSFCTFQ